MTNRELISRVRGTLKEHQADTHLFNRHIYSILKTKLFLLIKRAYEERRSLSMVSSVFQTVCVPMKAVSAIECCIDFPLDCQIYRSKDKLPGYVESSYGIIYKSVTSLDRSEKFTIITPYQYDIKSKVKYNKNKYVWIENGYLYSPQADYPMLRVTALFDDVVESCDSPETKTTCSILDQQFPCPDYLIDSVASMALEELKLFKGIQYDPVPNKQSA